MAQYRELAAFSQFASDLDETTRKQLERGQRVTEAMKQKQFSPLSVANMSFILFAADKGYLDDVPLNKVVDFEEAMHGYLSAHHQAILAEINQHCSLNDKVEAQMHDVLKAFKAAHAFT